MLKVRLDHQLAAKLEWAIERTGQTKSEVVRAALRELLSASAAPVGKDVRQN